jgi:hypothetical protein
MLPLSPQDLIACDLSSIKAELALTIALIHTPTDHCLQIAISVRGGFEVLCISILLGSKDDLQEC